MGVTAQGATFTYVGEMPVTMQQVSFVGSVVGLAVQTPQAETVDMTGAGAYGFDPAGASVIVPTGAWSGGSVTVEYLKKAGGANPQDGVRSFGTLTFTSPSHNVTKRVVCESASEEARVGELVKGSITFRLTDFTGY